MHLKRWLTSIVAFPLVLFLIAEGGMPFVLLICFVCAVSLYEYFSIVFPETLKTSLISFLGILCGCLMILAASRKMSDIMFLVFAINYLSSAMICVFKAGQPLGSTEVMAKQVQGMVYIPLMLAFLVFLRLGEFGTIWIFYLLFIIFAGDVGAYYVGTYMGKHKLMPAVSPKKTIEGAAGGILANILVGSLINLYLPNSPWGLDMPMLHWPSAILFFITAGAMGQVGDLFESLLKRAANIKDSGKILPGHGGLLDRIDALLFAAPVAYFFKEFIFGF
ncbi:MAG: phosphatidate cytidylyltransferase [Proteobacteria bacterium]|nr:phosphatidate cytidylyltransferase [Pseudomonadota bacterium]MBU4472491.1 phosphatidate cytidylyltransferase [Pseudomonadota bacterium]MCG2751317.1 phosphatidate cytidylyltransferase [Desulfobacteraceae bacterium]